MVNDLLFPYAQMRSVSRFEVDKGLLQIGFLKAKFGPGQKLGLRAVNT